MNSVTIKDNSLRANKIAIITPEMRKDFLMRGTPIPAHVKFLPMVDTKTGAKVQDVITVDRVFEGKHLENTIKRAKRFIRSKDFKNRVRPCRHVEFAMQVYNKADKEGFAKDVTAVRKIVTTI
jgi:hypothetical protein